MSIDRDVRDITRRESRGSAALWFGVLGSPVAWLGHLLLNYSLEEWFACSPATTDKVGQVSWTLNSLMALTAAAAGLISLASWRRLRRASDGDVLDRERWMAFAGMVEGVIFVGAILLGYLPPLLLDTCATSP
jgi:hypothetical protein